MLEDKGERIIVKGRWNENQSIDTNSKSRFPASKLQGIPASNLCLLTSNLPHLSSVFRLPASAHCPMSSARCRLQAGKVFGRRLNDDVIDNLLGADCASGNREVSRAV